MAIKATIHKALVDFSDLDRNIYTDHNLTIARHPSETDERMMIRLLAFVLNAPLNNDNGPLEFGKDMWDPDEPCLLQRDLTGLPVHWVDVGHPDDKRLLRACGRCPRVTAYAYGTTTEPWWSKTGPRVARAKNLSVWELPPEQTEALGELADRSMNLQFSLQDDVLYVGAGSRSVEVTPRRLFGPQ
jgi:uncharacterized protein YaeQ